MQEPNNNEKLGNQLASEKDNSNSNTSSNTVDVSEEDYAAIKKIVKSSVDGVSLENDNSLQSNLRKSNNNEKANKKLTLQTQKSRRRFFHNFIERVSNKKLVLPKTISESKSPKRKLVTVLNIKNPANPRIVKSPKKPKTSPIADNLYESFVDFTNSNFYNEDEELQKALALSLMDVSAKGTTATAKIKPIGDVEKVSSTTANDFTFHSFKVSKKGNREASTVREKQKALKVQMRKNEDLLNAIKRSNYIQNLYKLSENKFATVFTSKLLKQRSQPLESITDSLLCFFCAAVFQRTQEQNFLLHLYGHCKNAMYHLPIHCVSTVSLPNESFSSKERLKKLVIKSGSSSTAVNPTPGDMASIKVCQWINLYNLFIRQYDCEILNKKAHPWCQVCALYNGSTTISHGVPKKTSFPDHSELGSDSDDDDYYYEEEAKKDENEDEKHALSTEQTIDHLCQHTAYWRYMCTLCMQKGDNLKKLTILGNRFINLNEYTPSYIHDFDVCFNYRTLTGEGVNGGGCLFTVLTPMAVLKHMATHHSAVFRRFAPSVVLIKRLCTVVAVEQVLARFAIDAGVSPMMLAENKESFTKGDIEKMMMIDVGKNEESEKMLSRLN